MAFRVNHALASFMCNVYHRAAAKENRAHTFPSWFTLLYGIPTKFGLFVVCTRFLYANKKNIRCESQLMFRRQASTLCVYTVCFPFVSCVSCYKYACTRFSTCCIISMHTYDAYCAFKNLICLNIAWVIFLSCLFSNAFDKNEKYVMFYRAWHNKKRAVFFKLFEKYGN